MNWLDVIAWFLVFWGVLGLVFAGRDYSVGSAIADIAMISFGIIILADVVVLT